MAEKVVFFVVTSNKMLSIIRITTLKGREAFESN